MLTLQVETGDPRPVYRQVVDEIQRSVAIGVLKSEDPLPAVRKLATQLRVNPNTIQHAYQTLEREGTVYVKRGLGTFIAAVPRERDVKGRHAAVARQIAERMLREGYRQGVLASDLMAALQELAPKREG
jgi:GntR family transcriptional regulator